MLKHIINLHTKHKEFWINGRFKVLFKAGVLFILALIIQHFANDYVEKINGIAVGDLFLNHLPTLDIDLIIVQGTLLLTLIIILLLILKPKYLIFTLESLAIFISIRAVFISLTHLGSNPHEILFNSQGISFWLYDLIFNARGDFFFSGHTGIPFLLALIFFKEKSWRYFFFTVSILFGVSMLLGHVHYSIDVFAAPFMTYSIFAIAKKLFNEEYELIGK